MTKSLFPLTLLGLDTFLKVALFMFYILLGCSLRLFEHGAKGSKEDTQYNPASLLVVVCIAKQLTAVVMYLISDGTCRELMKGCIEHHELYIHYASPVGAYALYDIWCRIVVPLSGPSVKFLLMQEPLLFTCLFWSASVRRGSSKAMSRAVLVLLAGLLVLKHEESSASESKFMRSRLGGLFCAFISLPVLLRVFASICHEMLLKKHAAVPVNLQNVFMFCHSLVAHSVVLGLKGELESALHPSNLRFILCSPSIAPIAFLLVCIDIVSSFFLLHLGSAQKSIAFVLGLSLDAITKWLKFGVPIDLATWPAIILILGGAYLYWQSMESVPESLADDSEAES